MFITANALEGFSMCLEGFLFGKLSVLHALTLPLPLVVKEVQLFLGLGVYSGIFALYWQCPSNESRTRTPNAIFYILCLLYVSCAATVICDLIVYTFSVSNNSICNNIIFIISCAVSYQCTIASTQKWLTLNIKSHCSCSNRSKCLLWLHLPIPHSTR